MNTLVRYLGSISLAILFATALPGADDKPAADKPASDKPDAKVEAKADEKPAEKPAEKAADKKEDVKKEETKKEDAKPETKSESKTDDKKDVQKDDKKEPAKKDEKSDAKAAADDVKKPAEPVNTEAIAKFEKKMGDWKKLLKDMRALQQKAQGSPASESAALQKQWDALVADGTKLLPELRETGKAAYLAQPNADRELTRFLVKLAEDDLARDDYEGAQDIAGMLVSNNYDDKAIYNIAGVAAYATSDFDKAKEYLKIADEAKLLNEAGQKVYPTVSQYQELWAKEKELRKAEAEKNDLPRVKLTTSQGEIVVELLENEAPETVGNFISLVESKFYDNKLFHRVIPGFMAQGGCPKGDGTGGPGYNIYCECHKENARMHFRGSLSMAHAGRDTGGSQFFLTFLPTPHLNGGHTVFGRVIEGMDVLAKLQRTEGQGKGKVAPDKIVKAEVLRKRDHKYEPNKVK